MSTRLALVSGATAAFVALPIGSALLPGCAESVPTQDEGEGVLYISDTGDPFEPLTADLEACASTREASLEGLRDGEDVLLVDRICPGGTHTYDLPFGVVWLDARGPSDGLAFADRFGPIDVSLPQGSAVISCQAEPTLSVSSTIDARYALWLTFHEHACPGE